MKAHVPRAHKSHSQCRECLALARRFVSEVSNHGPQAKSPSACFCKYVLSVVTCVLQKPLRSCNRDCMAHKAEKTYYLALCRKNWPPPT